MQPTLGKGTSTKDTIIQILSEEWPLSVKQIYERVKKKSDHPLTYQAVHKVIKQLLGEGIVELKGKNYILNKNWLKQTHSAYEGLLKNYSIVSEQTGQFRHLEFDSMMDFGTFMINGFYLNNSLNPKKKECVCFWKHAICSFGLSEENNEACRRIFAYATHYGISASNTFLDRWASDYLTRFGKNCACGVKYSAQDYSFVQGDYLMLAFLPSDFDKEFSDFYETAKEFGSAEAKKYFDLITKKIKIFVVIFEDEKLADFWRQEAISLFQRSVQRAKTK